jgi:transposase
VGVETAAVLLVAAGDNPGRIRSEAAWARLCGVAPLPASSGKTTRHRLNRGGNRQANHALWRVVLTRMGNDERTLRGPGGVRLPAARELSSRDIWSGGPGPRMP